MPGKTILKALIRNYLYILFHTWYFDLLAYSWSRSESFGIPDPGAVVVVAPSPADSSSSGLPVGSLDMLQDMESAAKDVKKQNAVKRKRYKANDL